MRATYLKTIYVNRDNNFTIALYKAEKDSENELPVEIVREGGVFTAIGEDLPQFKHIVISFSGKWKNSEYGLQFSVDSFVTEKPLNKEGIVIYLTSSNIKGVGEKTAEKVADAFGDDTFDVIENNPEKLSNIKGISKKAIDSLIEFVKEDKEARELITFLGKYGVNRSKSILIYKKYGEDALEIVKKEPYKMCDIQGIGFLTADEIACSLGSKVNDPYRMLYLAQHIIATEESLTGSVCFPYLDISNKMREYVLKLNRVAVNSEYCLKILKRAIKSDYLGFTSNMIYQNKSLLYEKEIANNTMRLSFSNPVLSMDSMNFDKMIQEFERLNKIKLAVKQKEAVKNVFGKGLSVITGGPGTGKTTIVKAILYIFEQIREEDDDIPLLMAPTGRAARRLSETTNQSASTIHSRLNIYGEDDDYGNELLYEKIIIVDEFSMVDQYVCSKLLSRIATGSTVILVGDKDQLPSVGPGNVLYDIIRCGKIPVTKLIDIYRQDENSTIAKNSALIKQGITNLKYNDTDFRLIETNTPEITKSTIVNIYKQAVKEDGIDGVILLTPMRKKGSVSVNELNDILQNEINPRVTDSPTFKTNGKEFRIHDKVMKNKNGGGINNGDTGFILDIFNNDDDQLTVKIDFSGTVVEYCKEDMEKVDLAYATTIHKSQGSEYDTVIIAITNESRIMLQRKLIYTAITRAKKRVILIGQKNAINYSIVNNRFAKRNTLLADRIVSCFKIKTA
mgnify:FL=1|jgi:exodeoxyribonuclease V alpha subunit